MLLESKIQNTQRLPLSVSCILVIDISNDGESYVNTFTKVIFNYYEDE